MATVGGYKLPRTESPRFSLKSLQEQQKTQPWYSTYPRKTVIASLIHLRFEKAEFSASDYKGYMISAEQAANAAICLINQTNSLIDQKLRWMEEKFIKEGGFRENLFKKRLEARRSG